MKAQIFGLGILAVSMATLAMASACASMETPNNPTTQAWAQTSAVTGTAAGVVAAAAPAPWGQIVAGVLGAISVIAGIVAHSTVSKNSAQQVVNAVNTGLQAASLNLGAGNAGSAPLVK